MLEAPEQTASEVEFVDLTVDSDGGGGRQLQFERLEIGKKWADCDSD